MNKIIWFKNEEIKKQQKNKFEVICWYIYIYISGFGY